MIHFSYIAVVVVLLGFEATSALECVSCENSTCVPPPPTCELGQRPCSCCMECRIKLGGLCGPFTPECESQFVCLTNGGAFNGRPPYWMTYMGKCVRPESLAKSTTKPPQLVPTPPKMVGRK